MSDRRPGDVIQGTRGPRGRQGARVNSHGNFSIDACELAGQDRLSRGRPQRGRYVAGTRLVYGWLSGRAGSGRAG